jgi:hypothetical protein
METVKVSLPLSYIAAPWHGRAMDFLASFSLSRRRSERRARSEFFSLRLWSTRSKRSPAATKCGEEIVQ